jgi:hypothetical protein
MPPHPPGQTYMHTVSPDDVKITPPHRPEKWRCAPYHPARAMAAPTPLIMVMVIAVNYIPMVLFNLDMGLSAGRVAVVVAFHLLLGLCMVSWLYTCCTDPGTAPASFQQQAMEAAERGEDVSICRRSGLYKPPRSHYDSVTERLTLNMDHFCPWVVNTVGFYNRKFFMLFLIYVNCTLLICLVSLAAMAPTMWPWMGSETAKRHWFTD